MSRVIAHGMKNGHRLKTKAVKTKWMKLISVKPHHMPKSFELLCFKFWTALYMLEIYGVTRTLRVQERVGFH